jgi:hypothetical protein
MDGGSTQFVGPCCESSCGIVQDVKIQKFDSRRIYKGLSGVGHQEVMAQRLDDEQDTLQRKSSWSYRNHPTEKQEQDSTIGSRHRRRPIQRSNRNRSPQIRSQKLYNNNNNNYNSTYHVETGCHGDDILSNNSINGCYDDDRTRDL